MAVAWVMQVCVHRNLRAARGEEGLRKCLCAAFSFGSLHTCEAWRGKKWFCVCCSVGLGMEMPDQAFLAAAAAATEASHLHGRDAEHDMADLELDSLMATLMCS